MSPRVIGVVGAIAALIAACSSGQHTSEGTEPEVESAGGAAAPRAPEPCPATVFADTRTLCAAWEQTRRSGLPSLDVTRCELDPPVTGDEPTTHVLLALYTVDGQSRGDRYLVLGADGELIVVGDLSELFLGQRTEDWIGVRRHETADRDGDGHVEVQLAGGVGRQGPEGECLWAEEEQMWAVVCGARGPGYACVREELSYRRTVEISGGANPMSSQYDHAVAHRCAAQVRALGLSADGPERTAVTEQREARVDVGGGRIRVSSPSGTRDDSLARRLSAAPCPSGL